MKGGDVVMLTALRVLSDLQLLGRLHVVVVMTGDEEDPGEPLAAARQALLDAASGASVALGFEDGSGDPRRAIVSRRGFTGWKVSVTGTPAHSSQVFTERVGAGAIYELSRVLNGFYERLSREELLSVNPGVALGGTTVDFDDRTRKAPPRARRTSSRVTPWPRATSAPLRRPSSTPPSKPCATSRRRTCPGRARR